MYDSVITAACTLPHKWAFGIYGIINGTPGATDSVDVQYSVSDNLHYTIYSRSYRLPFWYASGTYGFGSPYSNLDTFGLYFPGTYTREVSITVLGYTDNYAYQLDTVGANCVTGITNIETYDFSAWLASSICHMPALLGYVASGAIDGTPSSEDSIYIYVDLRDGSTELHKVPVLGSASGGYYYRDSFYHTFTSVISTSPYARVWSSSGYFSNESFGPISVSYGDCHGGSLSPSFNDDAPWDWIDGHTSYVRVVCSLPFTDDYTFSGTVLDSAMYCTSVRVHLSFGDGSDTTVTAGIGHDAMGNYSYSGHVSHTFTLPGTYAEVENDTACGYTGSYAYAYSSFSSPLFAGSACSLVSGVFYIDTNGNCIRDSGEIALSYWPYEIIDYTTGISSYGWADENGIYSLNTLVGDSITMVSDPLGIHTGHAASGASLYPSCPTSGTISTRVATSVEDTGNFAFTCITPGDMDMAVSGWGIHFVPGQVGYINIWSSNPWGYMCVPLSSSIMLALDHHLTYVGMLSGSSPASISGDTLRWNFSTVDNLLDFNASVKVVTDTSATIFDTLQNTLYVSPTSIADSDLSNNTYVWRRAVSSSWDPNEMSVSPTGVGPQGYIPNGTPLSYQVSFQNTGSAPAENITIVDTIDAHLNISTLQIVGTSSPVLVYQFGNVIKFRFNDINLPDSSSDPTGSIGTLEYNIQPFDSLAAGTQIKNKAGIYFDYNPAVYTNTAINTIDDTIGTITAAADTICIGTSTTLHCSAIGGTWAVSNSRLSISTAGVVAGISSGLDTVYYLLYGGQICSKALSVISVPVVGSIAGASSICDHDTARFADSVSGGLWSSSVTTVATVNISGVVTGLSPGIDTIKYTVTNSCGSASKTAIFSVMPLPFAGSISGMSIVCADTTIALSDTVHGGTWSSDSSSVATVDGSGTVHGRSAGSTTITYSLTNSCGTDYAFHRVTVNPLAVAGTLVGTTIICQDSSRSFSDTGGTTGGIWSSSNAAVATVTGGLVRGLSGGTSTITYSVTNSCGTEFTTKGITIDPLPSVSPITGAASVCPGATRALADSTSGGIWSSANTVIATVDSRGIVTAVSGGITDISYSVTNSCGITSVTAVLPVDIAPFVSNITGTATLCAGGSVTFSDSTPGGTWNSTSSAIATVNATGVVTGVSSGIDTISYSLLFYCGLATARQIIVVQPLPDTGFITGIDSLCPGDTATMSTTVAGGSWNSSVPAVATVSGTGTLTALSTGMTNILYTTTNSCGSSVANFPVSVREASLCPESITVLNLSKNATLFIYPNPSYQQFNLLLSSPKQQEMHITINTVSGKIVEQLNGVTNKTLKISLRQPPGIYFVSVVTDDDNWVEKLIIK